MVLHISPIAMSLAELYDKFYAYIDGHDLVLTKEVPRLKVFLGEYKYRGTKISLPTEWIEREHIKRGDKIHKFLDTKKKQTIIRLCLKP